MDPESDLSFLQSVVDALSHQTGVIDRKGALIWANQAWLAFDDANGLANESGNGEKNFLNECQALADDGSADFKEIVSGMKSVLSGQEPEFEYEYPCHFELEQQWYRTKIMPLHESRNDLFLVAHYDITKYKLAETKLKEQAGLDALTGIANRRRFDDFLLDEWNRAKRSGGSVALLMADIDFFKAYNDHYGHMAGDECLRTVSETLSAFTRRSSDLVARFGGEEFAIVLGNASLEAALETANKINAAILACNISPALAARQQCVTISVGVAAMTPSEHGNLKPRDLVETADEALYVAKKTGRNRVCTIDNMHSAHIDVKE